MAPESICRTFLRYITSLLLQRSKNALVNTAYRWKFPIPYILGDDLGVFLYGFYTNEHTHKHTVYCFMLTCGHFDSNLITILDPFARAIHSSDLNAKGCVHQAFEMYRLKSCIDFKPYEGEKTYIKFEKRGGYVMPNDA